MIEPVMKVKRIRLRTFRNDIGEVVKMMQQPNNCGGCSGCIFNDSFSSWYCGGFECIEYSKDKEYTVYYIYEETDD